MIEMHLMEVDAVLGRVKVKQLSTEVRQFDR